jgi:hypothetical protein
MQMVASEFLAYPAARAITCPAVSSLLRAPIRAKEASMSNGAWGIVAVTVRGRTQASAL